MAYIPKSKDYWNMNFGQELWDKSEYNFSNSNVVNEVYYGSIKNEENYHIALQFAACLWLVMDEFDSKVGWYDSSTKTYRPFEQGVRLFTERYSFLLSDLITRLVSQYKLTYDMILIAEQDVRKLPPHRITYLANECEFYGMFEDLI